jgi:hypothetical protein
MHGWATGSVVSAALLKLRVPKRLAGSPSRLFSG